MINKIAKHIGLLVFAIIFLAMPVLMTLSVIYNWGFFWGWLLGTAVGLEIIVIVLFLGVYINDNW